MGVLRRRGASAQIVDEYRRPLHRFLTRLLYGQEDLAEDLVQETLLRAWRHAATLVADRSKIAPWLYTVARHVAIDAIRARRVRPPEVSLPDLHRVPSVEDDMDRVVSVHAVRLAMGKLSRSTGTCSSRCTTGAPRSPRRRRVWGYPRVR